MHLIEKQYRIVPVNFLRNAKYQLKDPLYISVEFIDDKVIASLDDIEAFAVADTEYEAINFLCEEIVEIYEDLISDRENLGALPQKWLNHLECIILCK